MTTQDIIRKAIPPEKIQALEVKIPTMIRILKSDSFQRLVILTVILGTWQLLAMYIHKNVNNGHLIMPTFSDTFSKLLELVGLAQLYTPTEQAIWITPFLKAVGLTILFLIGCTMIGTLLGFLGAAFTISTRVGRNWQELVAPPMSSLPAVALIAVAILAFSNNVQSMAFVVINAVFWTVLAATHAGFSHVSETLRRVGQNYGLSSFTFVRKVLFPAALPSVITGIRLGISRAFQAFVAVEMVTGAVYTNEAMGFAGALGFAINEARNQFDPPTVYACLFVIMIISNILDNQFFGWLEKKTIIKWGMKTA